MARPKKQTVDYFPHQCNHTGKTMFILEQKYGNDGFSFWFKLLEQLGCSDGHFLDLNEKTTWSFLCAKSRVSEQVADEILNLLADIEAINRELWQQDRVIWVQNFVDGVADAYRNRKSDLPTKPSLKRKIDPSYTNNLRKIESEKAQSDVINTHTILNDTKLKETILNDTKEKRMVEALRLSTSLADLILINKPDYRELQNGTREKRIATWAADIEKMIRIDARSPDRVEAVIVWSQQDNFWFKNILSGATLREKFDRLEMDMKIPNRKQTDKLSGIKAWVEKKQKEFDDAEK